MRAQIVICLAVATCFMGCTHSPHSASPTPTATVAIDPTPTGTWLFDFAGEEVRIELSADERWQWWPPASKRATQSGTWFIHQRVLVLRIEQSESDKLPAGLALTYEVRSISAQAIVLYDLLTKHEITWRRAA